MRNGGVDVEGLVEEVQADENQRHDQEVNRPYHDAQQQCAAPRLGQKRQQQSGGGPQNPLAR